MTHQLSFDVDGLKGAFRLPVAKPGEGEKRAEQPGRQYVHLNLDPRFWPYHQRNPHVYRLICAVFREELAAGRNSYGVKAAAERLRWNPAVRTKGKPFKLDNRLVSSYARLIRFREKDIAHMIELRS